MFERFSFLRRPKSLLILVVLPVVGAAFAFHAILSKDAGFFSEAGPVERLSALFLMLAAAILAIRETRPSRQSRWHQVVLILAAALRELDWDKAFTERGILSLGLYTGDHPAEQKLLGAVALTLLVWAGLRLMRRNLRPWLASLSRGSPASWMMLAAVLLYGVAKSVDGLGRKLAPLGIEVSSRMNTLVGRSEEVMELLGAILILLAVAGAGQRGALER